MSSYNFRVIFLNLYVVRVSLTDLHQSLDNFGNIFLAKLSKYAYDHVEQISNAVFLGTKLVDRFGHASEIFGSRSSNVELLLSLCFYSSACFLLPVVKIISVILQLHTHQH